MIGFSDDAVERVITTMMALVDRPRPRVAIVPAALERHLFAFVWFPRDFVPPRERPLDLDITRPATTPARAGS